MLSFLSPANTCLPYQRLRRSTCKSRKWPSFACPTHAQAAQHLIEVESRFHVSPDAKKTLNLFAGDCKHVCFKDQYYCEQLALLDKWLRQRNHQWQLKIPVQFRSSSHCGAVVYKELVGNDALQHVEQLGLSIYAMDIYATITTERSIWSFESRVPWGHYHMQITADECFADHGFQYSIGEIEVLVHEDDQIDGASKAIERMFQQLQLEKVGNSGGKLMRYLRENKYQLYTRLEQRGVAKGNRDSS